MMFTYASRKIKLELQQTQKMKCRYVELTNFSKGIFAKMYLKKMKYNYIIPPDSKE